MGIDTDTPRAVRMRSMNATNSKLDAALQWAKLMPIFPVRPDQSKAPLTEHGFKDATQDERQIREWWERNPDANIAAVPSSIGRCVVDADGAAGKQSLEELAAIFGGMPPTLITQTPNDGFHFWFEGELPPSVGKLAPGVDTRGRGSYVLLPPSSIDGRPYKFLNDHPPAKLPEWLIPPKSTADATEAIDVDLDLPANVFRATAYVHLVDDPGSGRRNAGAFELATELLDMGLSWQTTLGLIWDYCEWWEGAGHSKEELETTVLSADRNRQNSGARDAALPPEETYAEFIGQTFDTAPEKKPSKWRLLDDAGMAELPEPRYRVKGLIPDRGVVMIYGKPRSFKSFIGLDIALSVATGTPVFGRFPSQKSDVVLCAGEAPHGTARKRIPAWKEARKVPKLPGFRMVAGVPSFNDPADVGALITSIKAASMAPGLVIVDTLGRAARGLDENKTSDAGLLMMAAEHIAGALDCTVILIHHSGKDETRGAAGSFRFAADADAVFAVKREGMVVELVCEKMKDDDEPDAIPLTAQLVGPGLVFSVAEPGAVAQAKVAARGEAFSNSDITEALRSLGGGPVATNVLATALAGDAPDEKLVAKLRKRLFRNWDGIYRAYVTAEPKSAGSEKGLEWGLPDYLK